MKFKMITLFLAAIGSLVLVVKALPGDYNHNPKAGTIYITSFDREHLLEERSVYSSAPKEKSISTTTIEVNPHKRFQKMDGFGFTLTGGSAMLLHQMNAESRNKVLQEIFGNGKNDLNVSYLRLSLGASDLDPKPFSYDDLDKGQTDENLNHFSLAKDTLHLIPILKQIKAINPEIKLLASPWSPPAWMKSNCDTKGGELLEKFYPSYANYFVNYIEGMNNHGLEVNAITVQNEPLHPGNNPSLLMHAEDQKNFIKNHLGPAFEKAGIDTKIIIYDHNADRPDYPMSILEDPEAARFIDGSAFHLYAGNIEAFSKVHEAFPDKNLYFTEQWVGAPGDFAKEMRWHTENLIIGASRNWCKTVLEWNLAADPDQNPHTDRGGCDRCLGAITIAGNAITRNPAYYIIGQASKFVQPGAFRVASSSKGEVPQVAFKNPDGSIACVLMNGSKHKKQLNIQIENQDFYVILPANSAGTVLINPEELK